MLTKKSSSTWINEWQSVPNFLMRTPNILWNRRIISVALAVWVRYAWWSCGYAIWSTVYAGPSGGDAFYFLVRIRDCFSQNELSCHVNDGRRSIQWCLSGRKQRWRHKILPFIWIVGSKYKFYYAQNTWRARTNENGLQENLNTIQGFSWRVYQTKSQNAVTKPWTREMKWLDNQLPVLPKLQRRVFQFV